MKVAAGILSVLILIGAAYFIYEHRNTMLTTLFKITGRGHDSGCQVMDAVLDNDPTRLTKLLKAGESPDGCTEDRAPLHQASKDPSGKLTSILIEYGANPNKTYNTESPLLEAAILNNTKSATELLAAGADINVGRRNPDGSVFDTPLMNAAAGDNWTFVEFLYQKGADITLTSSSGKTVASFAAASRVVGTNEEGKARDRIIAELQKLGWPWPPPRPTEVRAQIEAGTWPYTLL